MTLKKVEEIVDKIRSVSRDEAIQFLFKLANKGLEEDPTDPSPTAPSGSIPVYKKPNKNKKRKKKPGRLGFRKILSNLLKRAVKLGDNKDEITPEQFQRRRKSILKGFYNLIYAAYEDKDCIRLCKRLKRHRKEIFTFLDYDGVSPYNNHAEQQMRKPVIARKIIQQNRSDKGAEAQAILMTIFRTAELQGLNPIKQAQMLVKNKLLHKTEKAENIIKAA